LTLLLTGSEVESLMSDLAPALRVFEDALRSDPSDPQVAPLRVRTDLPGPGSATALMPGLMPGIEAYTVKVNAKFADATPALRGVVCVHSLRDGELLALLDSASVTAWRTGLAAALVTDRLAGREPASLGIIGAGAQARATARALAAIRPLRRLAVFDLLPAVGERFADRAEAELGVRGEACASPAQVAERAEVLVVATWAREPVLRDSQISAGAHVTTLGSDEPGKLELDADALASSTLIVDHRGLAREMGVTGNAGLPASAIDATASELFLESHPGRTSTAERTIYAPVGLPWQDLALSWLLLRAAADAGVGQHADLLR
jgi:ornithine cyclodeaminase